MFAFYQCEKCDTFYRVPKADPDLKLLSLVMPCPESRCDGSISIAELSGDKAVRGRNITAKELYTATMGHGFPEERIANVANVSMVLLEGKITDLDLMDHYPDDRKTVLFSLVVENGGVKYRVFFGSGGKGATIYKISEEENE